MDKAKGLGGNYLAPMHALTFTFTSTNAVPPSSESLISLPAQYPLRISAEYPFLSGANDSLL